jgi:hypothetical protein
VNYRKIVVRFRGLVIPNYFGPLGIPRLFQESPNPGDSRRTFGVLRERERGQTSLAVPPLGGGSRQLLWPVNSVKAISEQDRLYLRLCLLSSRTAPDANDGSVALLALLDIDLDDELAKGLSAPEVTTSVVELGFIRQGSSVRQFI